MLFKHFINYISASVYSPGRGRGRWIDSITDSMAVTLSKLWVIVEDRAAWCTAIPEAAKSQTDFETEHPPQHSPVNSETTWQKRSFCASLLYPNCSMEGRVLQMISMVCVSYPETVSSFSSQRGNLVKF